MYAAAATHHAVASWAKAEEWCTTQSGTTVTQSPFCTLQAHSCCCVDLRAASTARRNPSAAGRCRYHPHFCIDVSAKSAAGLPDGQWPQDACAGQSANGPQEACAGQSAHPHGLWHWSWAHWVPCPAQAPDPCPPHGLTYRTSVAAAGGSALSQSLACLHARKKRSGITRANASGMQQC